MLAELPRTATDGEAADDRAFCTSSPSSALIASAAYAYSIKYETLVLRRAGREAEVARSSGSATPSRSCRPSGSSSTGPTVCRRPPSSISTCSRCRIQQLARLSDLPDRPPAEDEIGRKLEALGPRRPDGDAEGPEAGDRPHAGHANRRDGDARAATSPADHPTPIAPAGRVRTARIVLAYVRDLFRLRVDKSTARVGLVAHRLRGGCSRPSAGASSTSRSRAGQRQRACAARPSAEISAARPDIVDRNGEMLATDVKTVSVFAEPRNIIDKDEAVELLTAVLPDLDARELRDKLGDQEGLRLGQARDHPEAAGRGPPPRHPGRRLRAGEQARLPERRRGRAHPRLRQHRQCRHRRHREVHRQPGPAGSATARASRAGDGPQAGRSSPSTCASSTRCATSSPKGMEQVQGEGRRPA